MAASLKLTAKGANELSLRVKHEDGGMILLLFFSLVDHIQVAGGVDRHAVRRLPREAIGQLRKVVLHSEAMVARADDRLVGEPPRPAKHRGGHGGHGGRRGCGDAGREAAAGNDWPVH